MSSPTPSLTESIGRTERTLRALMDQVLATTGGTFHEWVVLNLVADNGNEIERSQLSTRLANALQIDDTMAEATLADMADERLLQPAPRSAVALSDAGRKRYERIRSAVDQTTASLYAGLTADDVAITRRLLTTISERADIRLARA
jgi:DNA-binding MarR family transcriptional regulator